MNENYDKFSWATVTQSPASGDSLRIQFDGESAPLPITPETLVHSMLLPVGTRVWCQLSGRRVLILQDAPSYPSQPYRMSAVSGAFNSPGTGTSFSMAFTWPATANFTQAPICSLTHCGGTGSTAFYLILSAPPTTSGGTVVAIQRDGASATPTTIQWQVHGVQMFPNAASG